jgi:hypothetical protein
MKIYWGPTVLKYFAVVALVTVASTGLAAAERQDASSRDQQVQTRYNIFVMEGVLERAVAHGADRLRRQVRRVMPDMLLLSGEAQARGFRLEGYGVFFDVSVPVMRQTVAWSLRTFMQESGPSALQQLKTGIERSVSDTREKATVMLTSLAGQGLPYGTVATFSSNKGRTHQGGICFGDSGGPILVEGTNLIVAVASYVLSPNCTGNVGAYRVDQADDLEFITQFLEP